MRTSGGRTLLAVLDAAVADAAEADSAAGVCGGGGVDSTGEAFAGDLAAEGEERGGGD